jgi:hypothetical protein
MALDVSSLAAALKTSLSSWQQQFKEGNIDLETDSAKAPK